MQVIQNDVIKCCKMMSSNVALLHSNNCCVLEPAICEDLDLHVVIFLALIEFEEHNNLNNYIVIPSSSFVGDEMNALWRPSYTINCTNYF